MAEPQVFEAVPDELNFPAKISITWKIKRATEKKFLSFIKAVHTRNEHNIYPKIKVITVLKSVFDPFVIQVGVERHLNPQHVKISVLDRIGLTKMSCRFHAKSERDKMIFFRFGVKNPVSCDSQNENETELIPSIEDLLHCDTLTCLIEIDYEVTLIKPKPLSDHYSGQLGKDLFSMYNDGELTDCAVLCQGTRLDCHKAVICARSPVFKAMFTLNMQEKLTNEVTIEDFEPKVIEMIIKFMYAGEVEGLGENAAILLPAADKYDIEELKVACEIALIDRLNRANCLDTLILADMYNAADLKTWALELITRRGVNVVHPEWRDKMRPHPDLLMDICSFNNTSIEHVTE